MKFRENQRKVFLWVKFISTRNQHRDPTSTDFPDFEQFDLEILNMAIWKLSSQKVIFWGGGILYIL